MARRRDAALALVLAVLATVLAVFLGGRDAIPDVYAPLGSPLGRLADSLDLPAEQVEKASYGRELAIMRAPIGTSTTDSLNVTVERITQRDGKQSVVLNVGVQRHPGGDAIFTPWDLTRHISPPDLVFAPDLSRVDVNTLVCDERTGEIERLSITWTINGELNDTPSPGMLAVRGDDAVASGTFGDEQLSGGEGIVSAQIWPGEPNPVTASVRIDGRQRKPERCAPQP